MLVTSTPSIEGSKLILTSEQLWVALFELDTQELIILATIKNIVGGELKSYSILLTQARQEAMARMVANAEEMGADAVINFRYETSTIAAAASEVIAYGTAVRYQKQ